VSAVVLAPIRLAKAMPCWTAFPAGSDPSIGIRILVYIILSFVTIFATFKRPGRPRAFVVFKDESRD
jgi:hypothetical protein